MGNSFARVQAAYSARATEYVDVLGSITHAAAPDIALIETWADTLDGPVLDVGCGPGQWTQLLTNRGLDATGIDPVPAFIDHARATYPNTRYRVGRAEALDAADESLGGILAWYSLIHTDPPEVEAILLEFARCLRPGGGLVLGFFTGPALEPFDHAIATAYFWPADTVVSLLEKAGFTTGHTETRTDPGSRPHAAIVARR